MMKTTNKRNLTHRDFFEFQNRINAIVAEYDISDLESFYKTSRTGFPHMAEIVKEMIYLARRGGSSLSQSARDRDIQYKIEFPASDIKRDYVESPEVERGRIEGLPISSEVRKGDKIMSVLDILNSRDVFPTNRDLGRFADEVLHLKIGWEWDSRRSLSRKVWERVKTLPSSSREKVARDLRNLAIHRGLPPAVVEDNGFFSTWERVISDQVKKRDR